MTTSIVPGRRVVITGIGVISPVGNGLELFWKNLTGGMLGIGKLDRFDASDLRYRLRPRSAILIRLQYMDRKEARRMDRYCQLAVAAAAGGDRARAAWTSWPYRRRTGSAPSSAAASAVWKRWRSNIRSFIWAAVHSRISPLFIPMMISNMAAGKVSMIHGTKGANFCVTTACASGTHSIGEAFRAIKYGHLDACIAGGAEAPITPIAIAGFTNMTALTRESDPTCASIPFDVRRSGFVIGEGAGIVILESLESALRARRPIIWRNRRLWRDGRCLSHHQSRSGRRRRCPWPCAWRSSKPDSNRRNRLHQCPRHQHAAE